MSFHRNPEIGCDYGGRSSFVCSEGDVGHTGGTAAEIRRDLREQGWVYRNGLDLCPEHKDWKPERAS